jgi:hypothetical protein
MVRGEIINLFKTISHFFGLHHLKYRMLHISEQGLTKEEIIDLNKTKPQNPFGIIALFAGGASFTFGMTYIIIPTLSIIFCILTYGTFDKEKEDNPWPFYLGFCLTLIGLILNIMGIHIQIVI